MKAMKRYAICAVALLGMAVTLRAAEPADSLAGVPDTVQTAAAEGAEGDAAATAAAAQTADKETALTEAQLWDKANTAPES